MTITTMAGIYASMVVGPHSSGCVQTPKCRASYPTANTQHIQFIDEFQRMKRYILVNQATMLVLES
jgi:hypothetical protein